MFECVVAGHEPCRVCRPYFCWHEYVLMGGRRHRFLECKNCDHQIVLSK